MKSEDAQNLINHSRSLADVIIQEDINLILLMDENGQPSVSGRYLLVYSPANSTAVHTIKYVLGDIDGTGAVVKAGQPMGICMKGELASADSLKSCSKCSRLCCAVHGKEINGKFLCPDHQPGTIQKALQFILGPFVVFED